MFRLRHEGSPQVQSGLSPERILTGLRDGLVDPTDEVRGPNDQDWIALENHPAFADAVEEIDLPPPRHPEEATSLDMNALIDVCLVLLIFFILTTSYAAAIQKVVPLAAAQEEKKDKGKRTIRTVTAAEVKSRMIQLAATLDADGKPAVRVENATVSVLAPDGRTVDPDKVAAELRPYVKGSDRKTEVLLDARGVSWGTVIALQDGARAAGIQKVHHRLRKN